MAARSFPPASRTAISAVEATLAAVVGGASCAPPEPGIGPEPEVATRAVDIAPRPRVDAEGDSAGGAAPSPTTSELPDSGAAALAAGDAEAPIEPPAADAPPMTFFVSSRGMNRGGDLGGLAGADAHCRRLASAAAAGNPGWRALLSTDVVDARSRIGDGPWHNHAGNLLATSVEQLFSRGVPFGRFRLEVMLDETGASVPSSSHDIVTGSDDQGYRVVGANCIGWTSDADFDAAIVGHSDNGGAQADNRDRGWVSAHVTGCTQASLSVDGGDARLYCFAEQ